MNAGAALEACVAAFLAAGAVVVVQLAVHAKAPAPAVLHRCFAGFVLAVAKGIAVVTQNFLDLAVAGFA